MITFLLSGFWHGASWNFVVWGALNGLAVLPAVLWARSPRLGPEDTAGGEGALPSLRALLRMLGTFAFACLTWVFFRARTLGDSAVVLSKVWAGPWTLSAVSAALSPSLWLLGLCGLLLASEWATRRQWHPLGWPSLPRPLRWLGYSLLLWASLGLAREQEGTFIYFQF